MELSLIQVKKVVEIKCISTAKGMQIDAAVTTNKSLKGIFVQSDLQHVNKNHNYYYQMQTQMRGTGRQYCVFCIWTLVDLHYIIIQKDDFFSQKMLKNSLDCFI